jgi:hypothetical protein
MFIPSLSCHMGFGFAELMGCVLSETGSKAYDCTTGNILMTFCGRRVGDIGSLVRGLFLVERRGDIRGEGGVAMVAGERRIVQGKMRVALRKTLRRLLSRLSSIRAGIGSYCSYGSYI